MTDRDRDMLAKQVDATAENIREFARQIESGDYGNRWTVVDDEHDRQATVVADDENAAIVAAIESEGWADEGDYSAERDSFDDPTIADDYGNETSIDEYPLEVVDERGREFAVVITVGGPHIEVVADGLSSARLEGYWGGERVTRYGNYLSTFLDWFIDRD